MKKILLSFILSIAGLCTSFAAEPVKGIIVTYDGSDTCYKLDDFPTVKYDNVGGVKYALLYLNDSASPVLRVALSDNSLVITYGEYTSTGIEGVEAEKVTITESAGKKIIRGGKLIIIGKDGKKYNASGVEIE